MLVNLWAPENMCEDSLKLKKKIIQTTLVTEHDNHFGFENWTYNNITQIMNKNILEHSVGT